MLMEVMAAVGPFGGIGPLSNNYHRVKRFRIRETRYDERMSIIPVRILGVG
jgi:hypothetical protein